MYACVFKLNETTTKNFEIPICFAISGVILFTYLDNIIYLFY